MKKIYAVVSILGLLLVIGTAGASDLDSISLGQALMQSVIGMSAFIGGIVGGAIDG